MQACLLTARKLGDRLMEGRALWQLGRLLGHEGQHAEAAVQKLEALVLLEQVLGRNHLDIAKCCTGEVQQHTRFRLVYAVWLLMKFTRLCRFGQDALHTA